MGVDHDLQLVDALGTCGRGAHVRTRLLAGARCLPEDGVAAAGGGEHQLRAVLPGPLHDHIDGRTAALARAQLEAFDDFRVGGPLVEADRMAVQRLDPRPGSRRAKQQVTAGLWKPQQVGQPGILIRVARDHQLRHTSSLPGASQVGPNDVSTSHTAATRISFPSPAKSAALRV
ncbi:hypothetical protein MHOL44478_23720 [Mycobacterium holsaticum DSM 44478]|nr:hypothetical protein [Mycolicibacterium holsaticum DSM 44478 = JCM 12374]